MARRDTFDYIKQVIEEAEDPDGELLKLRVVAGEPRSAPNHRTAAYWYVGQVSPDRTFGFAIPRDLFRVRVHFDWPNNDEAQLNTEFDVWDIGRSLHTAFRGDVTLGGNVTELEVSELSAGWVPFEGPPGVVRRTVEFDLSMRDNVVDSVAE